jgi:uncharacterized protein YbbK (DUF523 family)
MSSPLRIAISACLLGQAVRWDGGHKRDEGLLDALGAEVEWVAVCPELELGMGVPREPIHLRRRAGALRLIGVASGRDWTAAMETYAARRSRELASLGLDGYVLKARSPSCGLRGLPVHDASGERVEMRDGVGRFADALRELLEDLPLVEETELATEAGRAAFLAAAERRRRRRLGERSL